MEDRRGEVLDKPLFREVFLKRTSYLLSKRVVKEQEVYNLVRDFFKEYLQVDYEFTKEELEEEMKKVYLEPKMRDKISSFLNRAFSIQYNEQPLEDKELRVLLQDFTKLVNTLIHRYKKKSFMQKLMSRFKNDSSDESDSASQIVSEQGEFSQLFQKAEDAVGNDVEQAKELYKQLNQLYSGLDEKKKKKFFKPMGQLYERIKASQAP